MFLTIDARALTVLFTQAATVTLRRVNHGTEHVLLVHLAEKSQQGAYGANRVSIRATALPSKKGDDDERSHRNT